MHHKPLFASIVVIFTLFVLFASATPALASTCGDTVTVQRGDTLSKIAVRCGVTVNGTIRVNNMTIDPNSDLRSIVSPFGWNQKTPATGCDTSAGDLGKFVSWIFAADMIFLLI